MSVKLSFLNIFSDSKGKNKIEFLQGDLLCGKSGFDFILSNPPYVPHCEVEKLLLDGRSEPRLALDGDITETGDRAKINGYELDDGLTIIKNLIPQIKEHLNPKGTVLMEAGEYNAQATAAWAKNWAFKTQIYPDLEGQLRVVEFK